MPPFAFLVEMLDCAMPRQLGVPDVVRLVVQNHDARFVSDALAECRADVQRSRRSHRRPHEGVKLTGSFRLAFWIQLVDVGKIKHAVARAARLVALDDVEVPVAFPRRWNERVCVKNLPAAEIFQQAFVDGEPGRDDEEPRRHLGVRLAQRVEITPDDGEAHALRLAGTGGEFEGVFGPGVFRRRHPRGEDFRIDIPVGAL